MVTSTLATPPVAPISVTELVKVEVYTLAPGAVLLNEDCDAVYAEQGDFGAPLENAGASKAGF